jgi:cobalt-zinc-cadmium efflux system protein
VLREHRDLNTRAALLHLAGDALASLMVAVAGGIIFATGGTFWLDPLAGIAVGLLISWQALRLLRECARVLLESSPAGLDVAALQAQMSAVEGVASVHDLHVWSLSSELPLLSAHVVATGHPTLEEAQQVGERVKLAVAGAFGITHATLELECEACPPAGCAITPASAATVAYEDGRRHRHS